MKLSYADVRRYDADPRTYAAPVQQLPVEGIRAPALPRSIDPAHANCDVPPGQPVNGDTTYLTVVDRKSQWQHRELDSSVYAEFGSAVTVEGMGFISQNRGGGFTLDPGHPNVLSRAASARSTPIIPAFMERGCARHIGFGIMGAANLAPLAHAQFVANFVDYGMNLQWRLWKPRVSGKKTSSGCDVSIESRVPSSTPTSNFQERGHQIAIRRPYTQEMGRPARLSCTIRKLRPTTRRPIRAPMKLGCARTAYVGTPGEWLPDLVQLHRDSSSPSGPIGVPATKNRSISRMEQAALDEERVHLFQHLVGRRNFGREARITA